MAVERELEVKFGKFNMCTWNDNYLVNVLQKCEIMNL